MGVTKQVRREDWAAYFEELVRRQLRSDSCPTRPRSGWLKRREGSISALEVMRSDGTKEVMRFQRGGVPAPIYPVA